MEITLTGAGKVPLDSYVFYYSLLFVGHLYSVPGLAFHVVPPYLVTINAKPCTPG